MRSMVEGWRRIACDPTTAARSTPPSRREDAPRHLPIRSANGEETVTLAPENIVALAEKYSALSTPCDFMTPTFATPLAPPP